MKKPAYFRIIVPVVLALVAPLLSYTAYQFVTFNRTEELIRSIYERNLDGILFSVNQHCWDVFRSYMTETQSRFEPALSGDTAAALIGRFAGFADTRRPVSDLFFRFPGGATTGLPLSAAGPDVDDASAREKFGVVFSGSRAALERNVRFARTGYVRPLTARWLDRPPHSIMLFPALAAAPDSSMPPFAGLLVNDSLFFSDVAGRKFGEMDDGELVFAVRRKNTGAIMYSTAPLTQASFEKSGPFWLYPDMELLTGVAGTTLGQLARRRSARNLLFLAFVNIVLLAGVAYRVDNSPAHETRGSGLGLSLVKHAMDAHRGTITVESAPGNGSTFTVRFPIRQAPA